MARLKKVSSYSLKRLGYTAEQIAAMSPGKRLRIILAHGSNVGNTHRVDYHALIETIK